MDLLTLCDKIGLQQEVRRNVAAYYGTMDVEGMEPALRKLMQTETCARAREELRGLLGPDPGRFKMLTCMLICGTRIYSWYEEKGIPEEIFIDTMGCFPRFIEECKKITGEYGFDREWWTGRQIGGRLFRVGELEYEMIRREGAPAVSIHIPSDAVLTEKCCDESLERGKDFFARFFPEYRGRAYICHSWLLGPELTSLLPPESNIVRFQRRFRIQRVDYGDREFVEWVFKTRGVRLEALPEDTLLQRNMKRHLLKGGEIGTGFGILEG